MAQPPEGYYLPAAGKTGTELRTALYNIIRGHTVSTYTDLWTHFQTTDDTPDGKVWDMYSDKPGFAPPYVYVFGDNQCGNYTKEGDCYNREHSFPKSWFGGEVLPMYTDLYHVYPTDGWVNNKRGNYPFGVVSSPTWTSLNGSRLGPNTWPGYSEVVFEPIDAFKGDFARSMFYMATRYYGEDTSWPTDGEMFTGADPKSWAISMLLNWHNADPVNQKEIDRNNAVYGIQNNRNPFIDKPEYAVHIWGDPSFTGGVPALSAKPVIYPVPARDYIDISLPFEVAGEVEVRLTNIAGREILALRVEYAEPLRIDISSLPAGIYIVTLITGQNRTGSLLPIVK
jgi:endonuclease I